MNGAFVDVLGVLFAPELRLRLHVGGTSGLSPTEGYLVIEYDPEIQEGRFTMLPSEEQRAVYRRIPALADLADAPIAFRSERSLMLARIGCQWEQSEANVLLRITDDAYAFRLHLINVDRDLPQDFPLDAKQLLQACLSNAAALTSFRGKSLTDIARGVKSLVVCVQADALDVLDVSSSDLTESEPGWFALTCREAN